MTMPHLADLAHTLFTESDDALFLFDADSQRLLDLNPAARRAAGLPAEGLPPHALGDLFTAEAPDGLAPLCRAVRAGERMPQADGFRLRRAGQPPLPVRLSVAPAFGPTPAVLVRARADDVCASEARCRCLLENLEQSVFLKDAGLRIVAANRRFCDGLGRTEAEILGKTDFDVYPPALAEKYRADDRRVLALGHRLEAEEPKLMDGRLRTVRVIKTPVRDGQGHVTGVLGIFWDATDQHALEEQLRQAEKMEAVSQLAGGIAHDFNNLLTAITGNLALLKAALPPGGAGRGQAETAERAAWRAAGLTRQLLGFSRRTLLRPEPACLNPTVDEVVALLGRSLDPRIAVEARKAADLWPVEADRGQISQVLMNLCLNARDALLPLLDGAGANGGDWDHGAGDLPAQGSSVEDTWPMPSGPSRRPAGGRLVLETTNVTLGESDMGRRLDARPGDYVRLRVCDNGTGIPPELLPRIFEPFFTTKGPDCGTGLGLAMTFGIVQQHRGWVECRSAPDWGTCFDVYLPRHQATAAAQELPPAAEGRETILLADDEAPLRELARGILERHGYAVLLARDGAEAVELYDRERSRIDLVILDLTMPRLCGREALRQLRQIEPGVPVLLASGYSAGHVTPEERRHVLGFVGKPYRPEDLAAAVRAALERCRALA